MVVSSLDHPVDFHALVDSGINKPARYMGHELGVEPRDWQKAASVRWALTYPEIYEVGSSNLGHIILYSILNALPGQLCDRAIFQRLIWQAACGKVPRRCLPWKAVGLCRPSTSWVSVSVTNWVPPTSLRCWIWRRCPSAPLIGATCP